MNTDQAISLERANVIDPRKKFASRLKSSLPWRGFVICFTPIFEFLWAYILHFREKLLYLKSSYVSTPSQNLKRDAAEIYRDDPDFRAFALWLRSKIPESLLEEKRKEMLAAKNDGSFSITIESFLDEETRFEILKFALSDKVLKKTLPYFGLVPRIDTIFVMFNIPKPELKSPQGSQRWHRDADIYKMLSFYLCLTDLDENSGPYSAVKAKALNFHQVIPQEAYDPNVSVWKNGRHSDSYLRKFVDDSEILHLVGAKGTAALVDGSLCYHKGGFCKDRERLLFQVNYISDQTHESVSLIDRLKLRDHPRLSELIDSPLKRSLLRANSSKKGVFVYGLARRLLTRYVTPSS